MSADLIIQLVFNRWTLAVLALIAGFIFGLVFWRRYFEIRSGAIGDFNGEERSTTSNKTDIDRFSETADKIDAVENEIASIRASISSEAGYDNDILKKLDDLEEALKRANGRLKIVEKPLKRAITVD